MSFPEYIVVRLAEEGTRTEIMPGAWANLNEALVVIVEFDGREVARRRFEDEKVALYADAMDIDNVLEGIKTVLRPLGYEPELPPLVDAAAEVVQRFQRKTENDS